MIAPLTDLAMTDTMSKSHQRKEEEQMTPDETIEKWVRITMDEADSSDFRVGADISPYPEIKIAFDGYAEDDDGDDDKSKLSFAVYIHKDADTDGFVFPEHDVVRAVVHRPSEEVYHNVWYHREIDDFDYWFLAESVEETKVPYERIVSVIEALEKRFSSSEE